MGFLKIQSEFGGAGHVINSNVNFQMHAGAGGGRAKSQKRNLLRLVNFSINTGGISMNKSGTAFSDKIIIFDIMKAARI